MKVDNNLKGVTKKECELKRIKFSEKIKEIEFVNQTSDDEFIKIQVLNKVRIIYSMQLVCM